MIYIRDRIRIFLMSSLRESERQKSKVKLKSISRMGSTVLGKVLGLQKLCEQYENAAADTYRNTFEQNF